MKHFVQTELGKVVSSPQLSAFSNDPKKMEQITNLGQLAKRFLEEERAAKNVIEKSPAVEEVEEANPPKVEDKVESGDLPKQKEMATPGAPKSKDAKPKYEKLSNMIPAEITRSVKDEVPKVKGTFEDTEEMLDEKEVDKKVHDMHMSEGKAYTTKQIGGKWRVVNPDGVPLSGEYASKDAADNQVSGMNRSKTGDYGDKFARPSKKYESLRLSDSVPSKIKEMWRPPIGKNNPMDKDYHGKKKPGETWKTSDGKLGAKSKDGRIRYFQPDKSAEAREWATKGSVEREKRPQQ